MNNDFSEQVKAIRKKLKLTPAELARKIHVDKMTISRWERSERRPSQLAQREINRLIKNIKEE